MCARNVAPKRGPHARKARADVLVRACWLVLWHAMRASYSWTRRAPLKGNAKEPSDCVQGELLIRCVISVWALPGVGADTPLLLRLPLQCSTLASQ